jgi:pimeloyl-ACP methyl ester carboxylesterase
MSGSHRFLAVNGLKTHYLEAGDGPALILLHGGEYGAGAEVTWSACLGALAERYRVIAMDFHGYGYSDKVRDLRGQRRRQLEQVRQLLDSLAIESAHFIGTSLSGRLLLDAANGPEPRLPMTALVAVGVGLYPPQGPDHTALSQYDGSREGLRDILPVLFHDPSFTRSEEFLDYRYEFCAIPGAWEFGAASLLRRPGSERPVPRETRAPSYFSIVVPTCLVLGEHDRLVPRESWSQLGDQIPAVTRHVVPDVGHYPQVERPKEFCQLVLEFLETVDAPTT